jgi:DNA-binding CsgD family transcriptional regulator
MLVGRDAERAEVDRLLEDARRGRSGALVVRGEVGIGKTALLEYAASRAGDARVLHALGVDTESEFAFSGLHELVHPLLDRLGELPPVQAAALRGALALAEAQGVGRLYVGAATLSLLAAARADAPLVCFVDDAHWLDQASADALTFTARRLEAEGIAMVFAARGAPEDGFRATGIPAIELHGLEVEAAAALIEQRLGTRPPGKVVEALVAATGGNPLALHELSARLTQEQLTGVEPLPHPLPVGAALRDAFAAQADELSKPARDALVLAATADTRTLRVMARAGDLSRSALEECEAAGLITITDGELTFIHPLVRSAVYQRATPSDRRRAHQTLADAFAGEEQYAERRAWHLAAAAVEADETVANELEQAADAARIRRGHVAAAAMFERAARLTPATDPRARRLFLAAKSAWLAGQPDRALRLLDDAADATRDDLVRADVRHLRAHIELRCGTLGEEADDLVAEATRVEPLDPARAAVMLTAAADASSPGSRLDLAQRAASLAAGRGDAADLLSQLALAGALLESRDSVAAAEALERAKATLARNDELRHDPELILAVVEALPDLDDADDALVRELLDVATAAARDHAVVVLPQALLHAAWLDFERGQWTDAYLNFFESSRLADETGQRRERAGAIAGGALLDALQGRVGDAREAAEELTGLVTAAAREASASAARILGLIELGEGRGDTASVHLELAISDHTSSLLLRGLPDPRVDLVEAYLRAGRGDEAARVASDGSTSTDRSSSAAWIRALVSDVSSSQGSFREAVLRFGECPFLLARVRLNFGEVLRRIGERRDAREQLRAALELFETLGANPWSERARQELRASGATIRRREPNTIDTLTPQELQVARVVAAGATYKEAAAKLFLSPKTIEYHLGKIYRKLGIASGRQLAGRLAEEGLSEPT